MKNIEQVNLLKQERIHIEQVNLLKQEWRRYVERKISVSEDARVLAGVLGVKIVSPSELEFLLEIKGAVIMILNGYPIDPTKGHSSFLINNKIYELTLC
ncbi:hypothetical protein NLN94_20420, partial [Citrobacter portucalensis]|uniref:hypothetical protein n=1 Tax=Citrobacter portucalensis TaxID=1639133 RepID=UPI00226B0F4C